MMDYSYGMGGFSFWFGTLFMIVFWGAFIWFIVWLISQFNTNKTISNTKTSIEIIKERYAKGEITKKEYQDMINTIKR